MKLPCVYIITNKNNNVLYIGVTSNLAERINQHKQKKYNGFAARYNCDKLIFYIEFSCMIEAIAYEKKIKAGNRKNKEKLINNINPEWKDLSYGWIF